MHKHAHIIVNISLHRNLLCSCKILYVLHLMPSEPFSYFTIIKTHFLLAPLKCLLLHTNLLHIWKHIKEVDSQVQVACIVTYQLQNPANMFISKSIFCCLDVNSIQTSITMLFRRKNCILCQQEFTTLWVDGLLQYLFHSLF